MGSARQDRIRRRLEAWEPIARRGKRRFVIVNGMLGWGLSTGVLWAITMTALDPERSSFLVRLGLALVLFPLGGIAWGAATWSLTERFRRKHGGTAGD